MLVRLRPFPGNSDLRDCFRGDNESERTGGLGLCLFAGRDDSDADFCRARVSSTKALRMVAHIKQHMDGHHVKPERALHLSRL